MGRRATATAIARAGSRQRGFGQLLAITMPLGRFIITHIRLCSFFCLSTYANLGLRMRGFSAQWVGGSAGLSGSLGGFYGERGYGGAKLPQGEFRNYVRKWKKYIRGGYQLGNWSAIFRGFIFKKYAFNHKNLWKKINIYY